MRNPILLKQFCILCSNCRDELLGSLRAITSNSNEVSEHPPQWNASSSYFLLTLGDWLISKFYPSDYATIVISSALHCQLNMINLRQFPQRLFKPYALFSKQIVQQQSKLQEGSFEQMMKPTLQQPEIITEQDPNYKYVKDYTKSETKTEVIDDDPYSKTHVAKLSIDNNSILYNTNTTNSIDMVDNELALSVLKNKSIDLTDDRITLQTMKSDVLANDNMNQIDLGSVYVTPKNTINLGDVDVNNIPEDMNIQLDKESKQLYAIGVKTSNDGEYTDKLQINNTIIEDVSFQEFKDQHLYRFEQHFVVMNKMQALKSFIRWVPLYFIIYCICETYWELYYAKQKIELLEKQELIYQYKQIEQSQKYLLLNNPLFQRI